jgi:hypothetical protein
MKQKYNEHKMKRKNFGGGGGGGENKKTTPDQNMMKMNRTWTCNTHVIFED